MRKLALLTTLGAIALGLSGTAGAAGKQRVVVDRFAEPYVLAVDCAPFGPYAFEVLIEGHQRVSVTDVIARDGTLLQTVFSIGLSEIDTNSVSGETLTLKGAVHEVWDYAANTRTISGKVWSVRGEGGRIAHDVGRIVMTLDTHEPLSIAGPHEVFFLGGIDQVGCDALAG